jgi:hypothetical protein
MFCHTCAIFRLQLFYHALSATEYETEFPAKTNPNQEAPKLKLCKFRAVHFVRALPRLSDEFQEFCDTRLLGTKPVTLPGTVVQTPESVTVAVVLGTAEIPQLQRIVVLSRFFDLVSDDTVDV